MPTNHCCYVKNHGDSYIYPLHGDSYIYPTAIYWWYVDCKCLQTRNRQVEIISYQGVYNEGFGFTNPWDENYKDNDILKLLWK